MTVDAWAAFVCAGCAAALTVWGHVASCWQTRVGELDAGMSGFSPTIDDCAARPLVDRSALVVRRRR